MMNENNEVFSMEDEQVATAIQNMLKGSKWLSAFLESYRPPLDGEHYLTDKEVLYPESGLRELLEANYLKPLE